MCVLVFRKVYLRLKSTNYETQIRNVNIILAFNTLFIRFKNCSLQVEQHRRAIISGAIVVFVVDLFHFDIWRVSLAPLLHTGSLSVGACAALSKLLVVFFLLSVRVPPIPPPNLQWIYNNSSAFDIDYRNTFGVCLFVCVCVGLLIFVQLLVVLLFYLFTVIVLLLGEKAVLQFDSLPFLVVVIIIFFLPDYSLPQHSRKPPYIHCHKVQTAIDDFCFVEETMCVRVNLFLKRSAVLVWECCMKINQRLSSYLSMLFALLFFSMVVRSSASPFCITGHWAREVKVKVINICIWKCIRSENAKT